MNKIIAIVGMCGSGKSIACEYFENKGYKKVYFGGVTLDKIKELGLELNQENERKISRELREEYGMGAYALLLLPKIRELSKESNVVLDGLYSWDELKILKEEFKDDIVVLCIVVDKKHRYDRISKREFRSLDKESAIRRDISEIENSAKGGPIAYADYYILNNKDIDSYLNDLKEFEKDL